MLTQWLLSEPDGERTRISLLRKGVEIPLIPRVGDKVDLLGGDGIFIIEKIIWVEENSAWFVSIYVKKGEKV